jgi:hypothetical protein
MLFLIGQPFLSLAIIQLTPYLLYKKRFKSEINSFWTLGMKLRYNVILLQLQEKTYTI